MKGRPVDNPLHRFRDLEVAYDDGEGPPPAHVTILEDHSKSILSENDSPDVGFRWSANPYRGCLHACAYCVAPDTPVLLADSRWKRISDLQIGDAIIGTEPVPNTRYRRYVVTRVLAKWDTRKVAHRVTLSDGTELVASGDHRFLSDRGWKHVAPFERPAQRPHLTTNNSLIGTGRFAVPFAKDADYERGYLCGIVRGDALLKRYVGSKGVQHPFRLALADDEALVRSAEYLARAGVTTKRFRFAKATPTRREMFALRNHSRAAFERVHELIAWPQNPSETWSAGYLAGVFDAEGSRSRGILRIANGDLNVIAQAHRALERFGFDAVLEYPPSHVFNVRVRGGLREHLRFFHLFDPAISRKWNVVGARLKFSRARTKVAKIEDLGLRALVDITTGTGDFIANGVVSHNCYARPTHEYLDLGAGTDFDTKIVVKRQAAELLRATFDKPSWTGELVMFSGVTDCYQAIERDLKLTRGCLEVCAEYRNPVSIITKSPLIERDIDLLQQLHRDARVFVSVSLAWTDNELARQIEPWAPSPDRRFKLIETLAKAGIPVGIMAAPIIPGLNDNQIVKLLERASNAGARWAGWVLLRLPGAVAQVFPDRIRKAMPGSADKILHRIRETRGGEKLYDSRFHTRGRGQGVYAETIAMLFDTTCKRLGMNPREERDPEDAAAPTTFRRPDRSKQLSLF